MTDTAHIHETEDRPRSKQETLWVKDSELIRRLGVPEKIARQTIAELDARKNSGFPQKQPLWGNRRFWPDIEAYFKRHYGLNMGVQPMRRAS